MVPSGAAVCECGVWHQVEGRVCAVCSRYVCRETECYVTHV